MRFFRPGQLIVAVGCLLCWEAGSARDSWGEVPAELRVGRAGHAFDHVGPINDQAATAAASGATIIYASGFGSLGYEGLPATSELAVKREAFAKYNREAKGAGIELSIGYVCATSIVRLDGFDKNWSAEFRAQFKTPPGEWRQCDRAGRPLASWYGGDYHPACMNNPDWRAYERAVVRMQLESGHDGIFFDNPTVHPQGCYCEHCMTKFAAYLKDAGVEVKSQAAGGGEGVVDVEAIRRAVDAHPQEFLKFRGITARDFLAHIGEFARTLNPRAAITCNNSLNTPDRLYAQARVHGYNIFEMSRAEDLVVVEDMRTQPRTEGGATFEYGPTYRQLHAIAHGKPVVAVTLVNDDYHTAPNLVRLAMAEAAAHGASYLSWPTWPQEQRARMTAAIRPQADLLRRNEALLNETTPRADVSLFLPFRRWVETETCAASALAAELTRANVQYAMFSEEEFTIPQGGTRRPVLLVESLGVLTPEEQAKVEAFKQAGGVLVAADQDDWLAKVRAGVGTPSVVVEGSPAVRAVVHDQPGRTIVHVYNLGVERLSSFEDRVTPAENAKLLVRVPLSAVKKITLQTADEAGTAGELPFEVRQDGDRSLVDMKIDALVVSALLIIE